MKCLKPIVLILFFSSILLNFTSCTVSRQHDNGKHKGWFTKQDNHRYQIDQTIVVYEQDHHRYKEPKSYKKSKSKKSHKDH